MSSPRDRLPANPTPQLVDLGPALCGDAEACLEREWLVTNGTGGYAFGTIGGTATRSYHGLLVAALRPPVERTVIVSGLREQMGRPGARRGVTLAGGPGGTLTSFRLEGLLPVWTHALGGARIERRLWMTDGAEATSVRYRLVDADGPIWLVIVPLVTARDHHDPVTYPGNTAPRRVLRDQRHAEVSLATPTGPVRLRVAIDRGSVSVGGPGVGGWTRGARLSAETARGLPDRTAAFAALRIETSLEPGETLTATFECALEPAAPGRRAATLAEARSRQRRLLRRAGAAVASPVTRQLVLAADQFIVRRRIPRSRGQRAFAGRSVIAGYPWFTDWTRDTMIALPGLTLATGRAAEAATILRSFARFRRDGLLPNSFPDDPDEEPGYHAMDAPLLFVEAVAAYEEATGDARLVDELLPGILDSLEWYLRGTRFGIGADPRDGLVRGAAPGVQLTWMDAKVDDWVVTPRRGKPVEIQGLWHNALRVAAGWLRRRGRVAEADRWEELAGLARASFAGRFWLDHLGYLADVVDGPAGDEVSLRPNQLLAISLRHPILEGEPARRALAACRATLLTPRGLRSLAPSDPGYRRSFQGDRRHRDAAYHNGTVWSWLVGPYAAAVLRLTGDREHARAVLEPFAIHLSEAGLGSVSEVFEPEPPFTPRGCVAQAWGVAEALRLWRLLES